jgi:hypothetical protein
VLEREQPWSSRTELSEPAIARLRDPDGDKLTLTSASASGHRVDIVDGATIRLTPAKAARRAVHADRQPIP